ncbi:MAG: hypothetical protein N3E45_12540 [Oscillatoriaceae bacterium SKW80]|nr:hypothetical protein [Oscillatoriaceae bacterium SKYG93]MCX8121630.1 hypothetical protein [Oscillatoriaceae bacterium SKW80]MDW8453938.1 hypothetical protein [Oscillatoriaceae cyanobacterium SKYGB_i_bin93]HIK28817.1 hypothetical protein [Oscillatoriaceae cyanobacterium M7585_C2015_266]
MLSKRLHNFFTTLVDNSWHSGVFWFIFSLTFAAIYGFLALKQAFSSPYVVQDDARQHVFWMQRFVDSGLFPNDWIANYMQSNAPSGYATLYRLAAAAGINPMLFNKILPPLLGVAATIYCFSVCTQLLPLPITGFIGSLLLNQSLWLKDDLISATPRSFFYPLFLAFFYYLLRRYRLLCLSALALMGLFYPPGILICAGLLILNFVGWKNWRLCLYARKYDYLFYAAGLAISLAFLLPQALTPSEFGPVVSVADAKKMPEFLPGGRVSFFLENFWSFWLNAERSGLLPWPLSSLPPLFATGLLLPLLLRFSYRFPLAKQVNSNIKFLSQIVLVSVGLFLAAHALLFKLYLPSRYTAHSLRVVLAIASALALTILLDAAFYYLRSRRICLFFPFACILLSCLILYPNFLKNFPKTNYKVGAVPQLYEFLQKQPKDSLIASLSPEANNIPSFAQRAILVGKEYALPYHVGYYQEIRQRALALIRAQYSPDLAAAKQLIKKYGIDFWLVERAAFITKYLDNNWLRQYQPATAEALANLQQGKLPALAKVLSSCKVLETENLVLLKASCILNH